MNLNGPSIIIIIIIIITTIIIIIIIIHLPLKVCNHEPI